MLKGKPPNQEPPDHEMPISVDYNELIPNVYKRPVALRINFPFGTFVRIQLTKSGLVSEHQTAVVQKNNLLYLSLCSNLPSAFVQVGEVIGTAKRIHPRTWIKEKVLGIKDTISKGSPTSTGSNSKRKRHEDRYIKSEKGSPEKLKQSKRKRVKAKIIKTENTSDDKIEKDNSSDMEAADMELCWTDSDTEEEFRPRKRLNFEGIKSYLRKHIDSKEKTCKLVKDEFKVDVYQSFLPTLSAERKAQETKIYFDESTQKKEKDYLKDSEDLYIYPFSEDYASKQVIFVETDEKEALTQNQSASKLSQQINVTEQNIQPPTVDTIYNTERGEKSKLEDNGKSKPDDLMDMIVVNEEKLEIVSKNTFFCSESKPHGFAFNFQGGNENQSGKDFAEDRTESSLQISFGRQLQNKSDSSQTCEERILEVDTLQDTKCEKTEDCNKKKNPQHLVKSLLYDLFNRIPDVSLLKKVTSLCSRGEKENLKIFLAKNPSIQAFTLVEVLNNAVCKSAQFFEISKLLLDHGASVDTQDDDGNTALHYAVQYYPTNKPTVDLLLERGSKTTIKNKCGSTAVVLADDFELKALMKELKQPKNRTKAALKKILNKSKIVSTPKRIMIEEESFLNSSPSILKKRKRSDASETPTKRIKLSDKIEYFQ